MFRDGVPAVGALRLEIAMFAPDGNDPVTEFPNELSVADLLILEFDQWTPNDQPRTHYATCTGTLCGAFESTL
jgi:hypothetical protein